MSAYNIKEYIAESKIQKKISELGEIITKDYQNKDLVCVGLLKGSCIFFSDLIRKIELPLKIDFISVSSYGEQTQSSGVVRISKDLSMSIENRDVLIIEDIIDSGNTLNYLMKNMEIRNPSSLKLCSLLSKPSRREQPVQIDYLGFEIPDVFVVGYGMDVAENYRNLPYIAEATSK